MSPSLRLFVPILFLVCACAPQPDPIDAGTELPPDAAVTPGVDAGEADAGTQEVVAPRTPAGDRLTWVLSMINGGSMTATDAELSAGFSSGFLAQVPVASIRGLFAQLAVSAPFDLFAIEEEISPHALVAVVRDARGHFWRIDLETVATEGDRIGGLLLAPAGDVDPALDTWEELEPALKALAPKVSYLEADVTNQSCEQVRGISANASLALGSAFKLYVLASLAREVEAGRRSWSERLAVKEDWKSLPSGTMHTVAAGTEYTLQHYAEQMISISDNTATDHLMHALGRAEVEKVVGAFHQEPGKTLPFLTTRELFILKLMLTAQEQQQYVDASIDVRRGLLEQYASRNPWTFQGSWGAPRRIEDLEWFASPEDLCRLLVELKRLGEAPVTAPVFSALSINQGVPAAPGLFQFVGFKGGSEPGVLNLTWLVQRSNDHRWRVVTLGVNDSTHPIDMTRAFYLATAARALAGR